MRSGSKSPTGGDYKSSYSKTELRSKDQQATQAKGMAYLEKSVHALNEFMKYQRDFNERMNVIGKRVMEVDRGHSRDDSTQGLKSDYQSPAKASKQS